MQYLPMYRERSSKDVSAIIVDGLQELWRGYAGEPQAPHEINFVHAARSGGLDPYLAAQEEVIEGK